jgi:AraC-like DNA-binding protein
VSRAVEEQKRRLLRAPGTRWTGPSPKPLDVPALARIACVSEAHFIRTFRATFGETPHRCLQRRRVERSMWLLRETDRSMTDICLDVGFTSLGTFSRTFRDIVGRSPSEFRRQAPKPYPVPTCFVMGWARPSSFGEGTVRVPA